MKLIRGCLMTLMVVSLWQCGKKAPPKPITKPKQKTATAWLMTADGSAQS